MVRKIKSLDEAPLNVFESIKRGFIKRGRFPSRRKFKEKKDGTVAPSQRTNLKPKNLVNLTVNSREILFTADTVFPFTLFPDTITLDREKLTIITRTFFRVAQTVSVPIGDILSVEADVGPFFGSVKINSRYFVDNPRIVNMFPRKDALTIQRLTQGYIIAHERKVDCSKFNTDKLVALLNDLGSEATT